MAIAFDSTYYLQQNPDVAAAISRGLIASAEAHYNEFGRFEGRDPNAFFDTSFYLSQYPDVAAAGVNPFQHFLTFGASEDRFSNATAASLIDSDGNGIANEFDNDAYLAANPDVAAAVEAGVFKDGYQHFAQFGQFEVRSGAQTVSGVALEGSLPTSGLLALTAGDDALNGTSSNDVFTGTGATLSSNDVINGGAGNDTLIVRTAITGSVAPTLRGVENVVIGNTSSSSYTFDATNATGATSFASRDQVGGATTVFSNIAAASTLSLDNANGTTTFGLLGSADRLGTTDAVTVNVTSSGTSTTAAGLSFGGDNSFEVLNINTNGSASFVAVANANTAITAVNVSGSASLTLSGADGFQNVTTVNASGLTGTAGLEIDLSQNSQAVSFTGGAGNDRVNFDGNLTSADTLVGGAGTDTVVIASGALGTGETLTALNTKVSGFEVLEFTGNTATTITGGTGTGAFTNSEITKILFNTTADDTVVNAGSSRTYAFGDVNTGAATLQLGSGVATVNVALESTTLGAGVDGLTVTANATAPAGQVNTINLASIGGGTVANTTGAITATAGSTINVTGSHDLTIGSLTNGGTVDASSFTGKLIVTGSTANDVITGGNTGSQLFGGQGIDIVKGGAGNDIISGNSATVDATSGLVTAIAAHTDANTLTGGAGNNTFAFGLQASGTAIIDTITDLKLGTAAATGAVDKLVFDVATPATAATVVTLTADQSSAITGATTLAGAIDAALTAANGAGNSVVQFTYGSDTYIAVNGVAGGTAFDGTQDHVVKVTGLVGTLDASDIALV